MNAIIPRRSFLKSALSTTTLLGLGNLSFLSRLPSVSAAEAKMDSKLVRFSAEIEPLVRLLEDTSRERLLEEVGMRIRRGLAYRELVAALLLAGVRNIQPRPVGFKFHAVLVINSAHMASMNSPDGDRWLPIFWALDQFKASQTRNKQEGDWHMPALDETTIPPSHKAKQAFVEAMDNWDEAAADVAAAGLARHVPPQDCFEIFCRFGARDFRDIGHKAIYTANSWRTLQTIGWQFSEPVLRSLAYALLQHEGENPSKRDGEPDRPLRRNQQRIGKLRDDWQAGKNDATATSEMLTTFRKGSSDEACDKVVELLGRGAGPQSIWDALFQAANEMLMRKPGITTLHSCTSANALHYAYQNTGSDETRRLLLLQNAAFIPLFRDRGGAQTGVEIDKIEPEPPKESGDKAVEEIFADLSSDKMQAARKALSYLKTSARPKPFLDAAQRLIYLKGSDAHDYKFSSAVFEDYQHLSPSVRDHYLAASVFWLRDSGQRDNSLVQRTRDALKS